MKVPYKCCGNCKFSEGFDVTRTGRFTRDTVGQCTFVPVLPPLPYSITSAYDFSSEFRKSAIQPTDGENCPVFEAIKPEVQPGRKLILWNGRGWERERNCIMVCGHTKKECVELLIKAGHFRMNLRELNTYGSFCWGTSMKGITPEPGVWVEYLGQSDKAPTRLL